MDYRAVAALLAMCLAAIVTGVALIHVPSAFIVGGALGVVYTLTVSDLDRRREKDDS